MPGVRTHCEPLVLRFYMYGTLSFALMCAPLPSFLSLSCSCCCGCGLHGVLAMVMSAVVRTEASGRLVDNSRQQ